MTAPSLLDELEGVVRLSEAATPGKWVSSGGELSTGPYWADGGAVQDALAEFADGLSDPPNAGFVAALVNWFRAHHAEIAAMAKRLAAAERDASPGRCKACGRATRAVCDGLDGNGLGCTNAQPIDIAATQEGKG